MVLIKVDASQYKELGQAMPEIRKIGLKRTATDFINIIDRNSPIDEGLLHKWFIYKQEDYLFDIRSPAHYVRYVNDGTGAIYPKKGKALRFKPGKKWKGKVNKDGYAYIKYSKGQRGQHFVEKSIREIKPRIEGHFKVAIDEVLG